MPSSLNTLQHNRLPWSVMLDRRGQYIAVSCPTLLFALKKWLFRSLYQQFAWTEQPKCLENGSHNIKKTAMDDNEQPLTSTIRLL